MKIALSCIVGNEESVIERFIRSFAPAIDCAYFTVATGTVERDDTVAIIDRICNELGIQFQVGIYHNAIKFPHVDDFGAARQASWTGANDCFSPDFILWADADDVLAPGAAVAIRSSANPSAPDVTVMPYHVRGDKQIVMRERMVRADVGSSWNFAIHEQLRFPRDVTYTIAKNAVFVHSPLVEKPGAHDRNIAILSSETSDSARYLFYLAQQFFQSGQSKRFLTYANAALACPGLETLERYELLMQLAQTDGQDSRKLAAEAFAIMPDRREALALLANYALMDGNHPAALALAKLMRATPRPTVTYWSQNNEWYGWKAAELYRQCLRSNDLGFAAENDFNGSLDMGRHVISIIHATLGRPEEALRIREMWLSRANHPENVEYIFGLHSWDAPSIRHLGGFVHSVTDQKGSATNYDVAAAMATGIIIVQAQDDCYPPDGWDDALIEIIATPYHPVFVAPNDGHRSDRLSVNTIMTRAYMDIKADRDPGETGFFHRGYATVYPDTENSFRAIQDAESGVCQYRDARDFVLFHDHPAFNPEIPWDATYQLENAPENYASGHELFMKRNPDAGPGCLDRKEWSP